MVEWRVQLLIMHADTGAKVLQLPNREQRFRKNCAGQGLAAVTAVESHSAAKVVGTESRCPAGPPLYVYYSKEDDVGGADAV